MTINQFELKLANYIQNSGRVSLAKCASFFKKSESTIKRGIYHINGYLPAEKAFLLDENEIESRIHYQDYLSLCAVDLSEYNSTPEERHQLIFLTLFLQDDISLARLYIELGLSETTRKNDRKSLQKRLATVGFRLEHIPGKGIMIRGEERQYRVRAAMQLLDIIELDEQDSFRARRANTPIQRLLAERFFEAGAPHFREAREKMREKVFHDEHRSVDYPSRKLTYLYYVLSQIRMRMGYRVHFDNSTLPEANPHQLFEDHEENLHFDYLVMSLNYKTPLPFPFDPRVDELTLSFIREVEKGLGITFYSRYGPYRMLYAYLYKSFVKNHLGYGFYDEHLLDTRKQFRELYSLVRKMAPVVKSLLGINLQEYQYTDICLILQRYLLRNRLHGVQTKRIVIISNYASEKIDFFVESLKTHFDVQLVGYFTINELHQLEELEFDEILTFSNRVRVVLQELGYASRKVPFYLTEEGLQSLETAGFYPSQNSKLRALDLVRELDAFLTLEEKTRYLLNHHSSHFI